jgi:hypothetical protein
MFEEADWDALHEIFEDEECVRYTIGTPKPERSLRWLFIMAIIVT